MSGWKSCISVKRERIAELVEKIDNLWILDQICKFIENMTREENKG